MHITRLWIDDLPPLQDFRVQFDKRLCIIRGNNGLGKTLVLEAMSLLGHAPVLDFEVWRQGQVPRVRIQVVLRDGDLAFLDALWDEQADAPSAFGRRCQEFQAGIACHGVFWTDAAIRAARQAAHRVRPKADGGDHQPIDIGFHLKLNPDYEDPRRETYGFLKECLSNEVQAAADLQVRRSAMQHNWSVRCSTEDQYLLIGLLHSVSRPALVDESAPDHWHPTLRAAILDKRVPDAPATLPGFVSYVNTDMYEWGTGLDLRESPKQLREDLTRVVHRRLQLTTASTDLYGRPEYRLRFADEVSRDWKKLFEGLGTPDLSSVSHHPENEKEPWTVRIGGQASDFASSGENQVFFLLSLTTCLQPQGACLLLDEPELHLSIAATRHLFEHLQALARAHDCQIVIVSHALFHAERFESELDTIYLRRKMVSKEVRTRAYYGDQAMAKFALEAHSDIKNALKPMMLPRGQVALNWFSLETVLPVDVRAAWGRAWRAVGGWVRRLPLPRRT